MRHALLSALFILAPAALADPQYRLLHRLYYPSQEEPSNFFERGTLDLSVRSTAALLPAPTAADDLHARLKPAHEFSDALYQIALAPLSGEDLFDISSVKACHLTAGVQESIILRYTSDAPSATPYAVDLFVSPIPRDGACPSNPTSLAAPQNTTLTVSLPRHPPLPELRAPPQMSQTGEPVKLPEEQTFLQKYWLYMVIFLGMMMFASGAAEDGQGGQSGGNGGQ